LSNEDSEDEKNPRLWKIDPATFTPLPKSDQIKHRLKGPLKTIGKVALFSLAMAYPITLIVLGLLFGAIVFWGSFAASAIILYFTLAKLGYARNFAGWGVSWKRFFGGLLGFPLAAGFYLGLIYLKLLALPLILAALGIGAVVLFRRDSSKT
jgi:hypothetical protein